MQKITCFSNKKEKLSHSLFKLNLFIIKHFSRKERMESTLIQKFNPVKLEIINDSNNHSVKEGSETHFRLYIVSECFKNKTKVQTHQEIYKLFTNEMGEKHLNKLHSLSIYSYSPEEYEKNKSLSENKIPPVCASKNKNKDIKL